MAQRVNITLPDELHQRLQAFKDSINVSAACQKVVEQIVSLEEAKAKAMSKKESAIARLKHQAKQTSDEWFQQGKKEGLDSAPDMDYEDFVAISEWTSSGRAAVELPHEYDSLDWLDESFENSECPQVLRSNYFDGFVEGVLEFWDEIRDEVESAA